MQNPILVTYATRYGSTQEVADSIAVVLREHGLMVEIQPIRKVQTLKGYRAIVLGSPLYIGSLHKDAQHFLSQNPEVLSKLPVAVFALGPTHDEKEWQASRDQLNKDLAKFPWLKLVALELFGGKYDPAKLRFLDKLIAILPASPLHNAPASDMRDWTAIRAWANNIADKL